MIITLKYINSFKEKFIGINMVTGQLIVYELDNDQIVVGNKLETKLEKFKLKGLMLDKKDFKGSDLMEWVEESYMEQKDKVRDVYFDKERIMKPARILYI
jgi:hypothetical protein